MSIENVMHVKIGEVKVARSPTILKATLGSCVGIAFISRKSGLFGLAHCLLPMAPDSSSEIGAKYVSQAIPSLMKLMDIKASDIRDVEVYVAGGSDMNDPEKIKASSPHIGEQNAMASRKILTDMGFRLSRFETGHKCAMQIHVVCESGKVEIYKIIESAKSIVE